MKPFLLSAWLACGAALAQTPTEMSLGGPDAKGPILYLPADQRTKNVGGSDGAGLCVFTSIGHSARFQNVDALKGLQSFMRTKPGGGWPEKVDQMIALYSTSQSLPKPNYIQLESKDPTLVKAAVESGRMPGVTYDGRDMHYRSHIEHMVNIVGYTNQYVVVFDNNFIGETEFVYLTPDEFVSRWVGVGGGGRQGWAVILLEPGRAPVEAK